MNPFSFKKEILISKNKLEALELVAKEKITEQKILFLDVMHTIGEEDILIKKWKSGFSIEKPRALWGFTAHNLANFIAFLEKKENTAPEYDKVPFLLHIKIKIQIFIFSCFGLV